MIAGGSSPYKYYNPETVPVCFVRLRLNIKHSTRSVHNQSHWFYFQMMPESNIATCTDFAHSSRRKSDPRSAAVAVSVSTFLFLCSLCGHEFVHRCTCIRLPYIPIYMYIAFCYTIFLYIYICIHVLAFMPCHYTYPQAAAKTAARTNWLVIFRLKWNVPNVLSENVYLVHTFTGSSCQRPKGLFSSNFHSRKMSWLTGKNFSKVSSTVM